MPILYRYEASIEIQELLDKASFDFSLLNYFFYFSHEHYQNIMNCLHITDLTTYLIYRQSLVYDILHQMWLLVNEEWNNFMV